MRTSLGLIFSALFVSAVLGAQIAPRTPIKLMPGLSYVYSYSGRLVSGIAQLDTNAAALELKSDLVLQPDEDGSRIAMKMINIRVGKHNGPVSEQLVGKIVIDHQPEQQYEEELSKPIRFVWQDGQVKAFEADRSEPEWSINIKKSILSLLNLNLTPKKIVRLHQEKVNTIHRPISDRLVVYPIYEDGINGICETLYQVTESADTWPTADQDEQVLNVTKTKNYANCLTEPTIEKTNIDVRGAPVLCREGKPYPVLDGYYPMSEDESNKADNGCPYGQSPDDSPVNSYNFAKYNISVKAQYAKIDSIYSEGKTVYETKGKQIVAITQQNMTLVQLVPTTEVGRIHPISNAVIHQELSFRLPKIEDESQKLDIPYYHLFGRINTDELKDLIPELLDSVAGDIADSDIESKKTAQKIVQLSNALAVLDRHSLKEIFEKVAKPGRAHRATPHQQIIRKLFLDLIGTVGTTDAALFVKHLYEKDEITTFEAKEIFEAIPQNLFLIDLSVVEEYLKLFLTEKVQQQRHLASSLGICLGKLINEATMKQPRGPGDLHDIESVQKQRRAQAQINDHMVYHQQMPAGSRIRRSAPWEHQFQHELIEKDQVMQVLHLLEKALREAPTFHQKVTLIESLAHTGLPEALRILVPFVNDQAPVEHLPGYPVENEEDIAEERNFIRQVSIYALAHIARHHPQEVLALLLPVYQNQLEPYELRIAAFTVMLHCDPGRQLLEQIASELHSENIRQVKSFVKSALETVSNSTEPSLKKVADDARFALGFAPNLDLGLQYSKMVGKGFYDEKKRHGLSLVTEWVASNQSQIPRSGYLALRQTDGPFHQDMIEVGYNAKGVDSLIERLVEPNGVLSEAIESFTSQTKDRRLLKRNVESARQTLQALKEKLNLAVRSEEEPKATIFFKLFERTSYYALDRHYLKQIIDSAEDSIKDLVSQLVQGKSYHYVKLVMPKELYRVVPSELGLPVIVTERHPTILSVKIDQAKLELDMPGKSGSSVAGILPTGANLTVQMQPSLFHTTYQFVFALTPATQEAIGTQVEKTTRVTLPLELSFGYQRAKNQISWSVVPKVPLEVYHHHTEAKTFISKASIAGSPDRDWLEDSVEIKSKPVPFQYEKEYLKEELGLGVRVHVTTEKSLDAEPWYQSRTAQKKGLWAALVELTTNDEITPCKVHLTLEPEQEKQVTGYDFSIRYKKVDEIEDDDDEDETEKPEIDDDDSKESNESGEKKQVRNRQQMVWARKAEKVWQKLLLNGVDSKKLLAKKSIKRHARQLMKESESIWKQHWNEEKKYGLNKESNDDDEKLPAIVAHNVLLTVATRSPRPTYYAVNALLAKTYDERAYWLKVNAYQKKEWDQETSRRDVNDDEKSVKQLCLESVVSYPVMPSEFYYEPIANQALKALIKAKIAFGDDCRTGAKIELDGVMEKTDEKVLLAARDLATDQSSQEVQSERDWFYQQCSIDRAQGKPLSYACERAIVENSYFNQLVLDVHYEKLSPKLANWTRKLVLATKVALYNHLDSNEIDVDNQDRKVRITAQFSNRFADIPMANLYIEAPEENVHFEKIHVPFFRPVSSLLSTVQVYQNLLTGYEHSDKCVLMEDFVRTFDNVTVELSASPCQYLVAKDCSAEEKFAVFARALDTESKTKTVTVMIGDSEIKLMPPTGSHTDQQVQVNGRSVDLSTEKDSVAETKKDDLSIYVRKTASDATSPIVVVRHSKHDLTVMYDGKNVKVIVGQKFKGQTCGVCGDNNDESENEFTGPDGCLYREAEDFVRSYALAGQHCEQTPVPEGQKVCPKKSVEVNKPYTSKKYSPLEEVIGQMSELKEAKKARRIANMQAQANREEFVRLHQEQIERQMSKQQQDQSQQEQSQPMTDAQRASLRGATAQQQQLMQRLRTHAFQTENNQICFSVQPVLTCVEGVSRPSKLRQEVIGFHCLPATSISAQRLADQARYQVLEIFGQKSVDLRTKIEVPVACTAA